MAAKKKSRRSKKPIPRKIAKAGSSKSDQIRSLLGSGLGATAIAKKVGCSPNLVYVVKSKAAGGIKPKRGRAKKASADSLGQLLSGVKELEAERGRLRPAVEKIGELVKTVS